MKAILLTSIIFTLAFIRGGQAVLPCEERSTIEEYNEFIARHIVTADFPRDSRKDWKKYLETEGLCGRAPVQSFIENADKEHVLKICGTAGRRPQTPDPSRPSLCISASTMFVYHITSNMETCKVEKVVGNRENVIVACKRVKNIIHTKDECLPVHYESGYIQPGNIPCA